MDVGYHQGSQVSWTMTVGRGDPIMLYAVTIDPLNAIYFVSDRPDDNEWDVQEGVELEIDPLYGTWTPDLGPLRQSLYVSTSDPKHFKVFLHSKDPGLREFRPTGRSFAGLFPKATWERIARHVPPALATLDVSVDEPPGATEAAIAALNQRG
jgi:hypothetical protein